MSLVYAVSPVHAQTTIVGQTLDTDTVWDSSMNPIFVSGDITIPDSVTLTIEDGCDIRFQENSDDTHWGWDITRSEIIVYGTLDIIGTPSAPVLLMSTGTGGNGWFGIIFSDSTATGTISYCNITRSVFGINFTACAPAPSHPVVSHCSINDVASGVFFDDNSAPELNTTTVNYASTAFDCWGHSAPTLTNCNAGNLTGDAMAIYATEYTTPTFIGCAFSSGSVELDIEAHVSMRDTTVSDSENGVIGHESLEFGAVVIPSTDCRMIMNNCNIIGIGDQGNGIEWDDNLDMLKVEYCRIAGFKENVWPRWGTEDPETGIAHAVGPRFAGVIYGTCAGGDNHYLIDDSVDFIAIGGRVGMTVTNDTDSSVGVVTDIISIPSYPVSYNTLEIGGGMSGGATNGLGDIYHFSRATDPNNIDMGDLNFPNPFRLWPAWYVLAGDYSDGYNEFYGVQNPDCLFNIRMEQSDIEPPELYQLEIWAENNWWVTTTDSVITRYMWDNHEDDYLGWIYYDDPLDPGSRILHEKRTYSVSGRILDDLGEPVEGVRVSTDISTQFPGHTVLADITSPDGYYTIYGLLPHATPYSIVPEKLAHTFVPSSISVAIDPAAPTDIVDQDFTVLVAPPTIFSVGRGDGEDGADYGLPGRTNWGLESENTPVIITGLNFRETPSVYLRGPLPDTTDIACSNVTWVTSTQLTGVVPAGMDIGDYSVVVDNPDDQRDVWGDAGTPGFTIVEPPAPEVDAISPNPINIYYSGYLTVTGENFLPGCELMIGNTKWSGISPSGGGTTILVVYSSGTLSAGTWPVTVINPDGQESNTDVTLTVSAGPPTATPTITPTGTITPLPTATPTPTALPGGYPRFQLSTNGTRFGTGDSLSIEFSLSPGAVFEYNYVDMYVAVMTPAGRLYFLSGGDWHDAPLAVFKGLFIGSSTTGSLGMFSIGPGLPRGTYTLHGVLTAPNQSVYNRQYWRSSLFSSSLTIE
jgi:hypothetical protein